MVNKERREEASAGARRVTKRIFEFYALLAPQFSLRRRQIRRQGVRRCIPINVTALTALFICAFKYLFLTSCFNAFHRTLFVLAAFYAN